MIFELSFLWYPTVAMGVSIVLGILISWATGKCLLTCLELRLLDLLDDR